MKRIAGVVLLSSYLVLWGSVFGAEGALSAAAVLQRVSETYENLKSCHVVAERDIEISTPVARSVSVRIMRT